MNTEREPESYSPVQWVFRENIEDEIKKKAPEEFSISASRKGFAKLRERSSGWKKKSLMDFSFYLSHIKK